ncbi:MAG: cysteine desulfurase-like protein [Thermoleophilaceae bacterium]
MARTGAIAFDVEGLRARFPALAGDAAYFDGPGGSQCPREVLDAVAGYLRDSNANLGGTFPTSADSDEVMARGRAAAADFTGGEPDGIAFGANMTTLNFLLAHAVARTLRPGDEIVVTQLDHDANVSPWMLVADDHDLVVRHAPIRRDDVTLDHEALERLIGERTRVVAFTLASNAVGSLTDPGRLAAAAHSVGALAWADAVHLAPHRRLRAREWGLDVLLCSPYKFFGPHAGVAAIRPDLAESLPADRVRPAAEQPPGHRFETGTQSHEAVAGTTAAIEYLRSLGDGSLDVAFERLGAHEDALAARFLEGLPGGVELYGIPAVAGRTPTFCFNVPGLGPREVAARLGELGLYVWDGDYYALEPMRALGLAEGGGAVRAGFLHYTTLDEVDRLLDALGSLAA